MLTRPSPAVADSLADLLQRARAARDASSLTEGRDLAERAWALAQQSGSDDERAEAGHLLCLFNYRLGSLATLLAVGDQVLPVLTAPERRSIRIDLLRWMTLAGCETGRFDGALNHANEACALAQDSGDQRQLALSLTALGACFERMGDPWQAERLMDDALRVAREVGDPFAQLVTLNNLCAVCVGAFYVLRGGDEPAEATAALRRALVHAREAHSLVAQFDDPFFSVFVEGNLGEVLLHLGKEHEARRLLDAALQRGLEHGFQAQIWRIRCSICELLLSQGQAQQAHAALKDLLRDMAGADPRSTLIRVHHALYRASRDLGRVGEALAHFEQHDKLERRRATNQLKAQSELFVTRVEAEYVRQQAERARREAQLERSRAAGFQADAQRDQLTGLGNRRHLDHRLPLLLDRARSQGLPLTVALIDLDHFKQINDRFGHATGDKVLIEMAQELRENTRSSDVLARIGGEEFLIVFADMPGPQAVEVCERLRRRVAEQDWDAVASGLHVTLSVGLAHAPPYDMATLFDAADRAMYRAKQGGRNRIAVA
ncbi:MAG TPA: tetratricopeptide repeat-containing diguanylate cyclase [Albitalea sp.]|uniref:GGDEF domain-containing protein n=1 Tax=Piscinibacter sp. TaxID=1903157 RepID=UPI002ED619CA